MISLPLLHSRALTGFLGRLKIIVWRQIIGNMMRWRLNISPDTSHVKTEEWRPAEDVHIKCKDLKINFGWQDPSPILFSHQSYQFFISLRFGLWKAGPGVSYGEWNDGPKLNGMPQLFLLNSERYPCLKIILPPQLAKDGINSFATMTKLFYKFQFCVLWFCWFGQGLRWLLLDCLPSRVLDKSLQPD